jgi:hypothetical protein
MRSTGYRLRMSTFIRMWRTGISVVLGVLFLGLLFEATSPPLVRLGCVVGIGLSVFGLRTVLGSAVVVRTEGLRVFTWWPKHRDIAWYRVFAVDVVPEGWLLELELNSGEKVLLPVVERVDVLYEQIEDLRSRLDA